MTRDEGGDRRTRLRAEPFSSVLDAAKAGAGWALERLYEELAPSVAGYLRLRGARDPEGLVHEVFVGVLRGIPRFEGGEDELRSWVFTIAHRRVVDDHRRRAVRPTTSVLDLDRHDHEGGDAESEALAALEHAWVERLLEILTVDQRDVVLLRILGDLSVERTATIVGKRPGAVKQLQRRALLRLREHLEEEGVTHEAVRAIAAVTWDDVTTAQMTMRSSRT